MGTGKSSRVTQREFLETARSHPVVYEYPGTFRAASLRVEIRPDLLVRFLDRLSSVLSFEEYERITRSVWVAHIGKNKTGWPTGPQVSG